MEIVQLVLLSFSLSMTPKIVGAIVHPKTLTSPNSAYMITWGFMSATSILLLAH